MLFWRSPVWRRGELLKAGDFQDSPNYSEIGVSPPARASPFALGGETMTHAGIPPFAPGGETMTHAGIPPFAPGGETMTHAGIPSCAPGGEIMTHAGIPSCAPGGMTYGCGVSRL
jgi:hypothetical protein